MKNWMLVGLTICAILLNPILSLSGEPDAKLVRPKEIPINKATDTERRTHDEELTASLAYLSNLDDTERPFKLFFTTAFIPTNEKIRVKLEGKEDIHTVSLREAIVPTLKFAINSLSAGEIVVQLTPVSETLYVMDIRDAEWTPQAVELVSQQDPFFRKPWVNATLYDTLRIESGNHLLRADWFIYYVLDTTKQLDVNKQPLYYELLYSQAGIPKTVEEFRAVWGFDVDKVEKLKLATGVIVEQGKSGVSRNNRQLYRARSEIGYYWETMDVKNMLGGRNYMENLVAGLRKEDVDAGEMITNNRVGMQVYFLTDGKGKRVDFADNTLVNDHSDPLDKRVRTAKSCIMCHAGGINYAINSLEEQLNLGLELRFKDKESQNKIQRFFLNPNFKQWLEDDRELYRRAIKNVNGLTPQENVAFFEAVYNWYRSPVSLEQASLECGVTVDEFKSKVNITTSGGLGGLVRGGSIPREIWDYDNKFTEAMLLIFNVEAQRYYETEKEEVAEEVEKVEPQQNNIKIEEQKTDLGSATLLLNAPLIKSKSTQVVANIPAGTVVNIRQKASGWSYVRYNNLDGWVQDKNLRFDE